MVIRTGWLLLAFPVAELISILVAADLIGALPTFLMIVAGGVAGVIVLRAAGRAAIGEMRAEARTGILDARVLVGASRLVLVAALLMIPGFVSDLIALAISIPAVRDLLARRVVATSPERSRPAGVVELERGDYRRLDEPRDPR